MSTHLIQNLIGFDPFKNIIKYNINLIRYNYDHFSFVVFFFVGLGGGGGGRACETCNMLFSSINNLIY